MGISFKTSKTSTCFFLVLQLFSIVFPKERNIKLAGSIILLPSDSNISSPVRYSYLSIFADDNADIFAASLLISVFQFLISNLIISCHG